MKRLILFFTIMLFTSSMAFGQWHIDEGFEGGAIPGDWTIIDGDGNGSWFPYEYASAHSGSWVAAVAGSGSGDNDWLITPQVTIQSGDSFSFYARSWYSTEDMDVMLSTSGTAIGDFDVTLESVTGIGDSWVEYAYDLSFYAGQDIYLAIHWIYDNYALLVDDVTVGQDPPLPVELSTFTAVYANGSSLLEWTTQSESNNLGWNIYRSETVLEDAVQINGHFIDGAGTSTEPTDYEFFDEQELVVNNTYWYWLESVGFSGETEIYSPISLTIPEPGENPDVPDLTITNVNNYPNPFSNATTISFDITAENTESIKVSIYNMKGQMITSVSVTLNGIEGSVSWDGKDTNGNEVTSGVYTYIIKTGAEEYTGKMILSK